MEDFDNKEYGQLIQQLADLVKGMDGVTTDVKEIFRELKSTTKKIFSIDGELKNHLNISTLRVEEFNRRIEEDNQRLNEIKRTTENMIGTIDEYYDALDTKIEKVDKNLTSEKSEREKLQTSVDTTLRTENRGRNNLFAFLTVVGILGALLVSLFSLLHTLGIIK